MKRLSESDRALLLGTVQNENRELFLQLAFVFASDWTVRRVCRLTWAEVWSRDWPSELLEILQQCSTEFEPWVFKYRSSGTVSDICHKLLR